MLRVSSNFEVLCLLILLLIASAGSVEASTDIQVGQFVKYQLSEHVELPGAAPVSQNVTETVLELCPNGTLVRFQFDFVGLSNSTDLFFSNGSMIFPYLGLETLSSPNATVTQVRDSFNLTFIQPNTTSSSADFTLTSKNINFNGNAYAGNLYSGRIAMMVNVTEALKALNLTEVPSILPLPLNIDVMVHTFSTDLVYNLTATTSINLGFAQPAAKAQMVLLSTNLSLGDPIPPIPWYVAIALLAPLGILGYILYRRRRASRLATQQGGKKPSYWVH